MGINKIIYGGVTKLDISNDTVTPSSLMEGYTAHDNTGTLITGTASSGSGQGNVWQDGEGNVHLDDESGLSLQTKTVSPSTSAQVVTADAGYYALEQVNVNAMTNGTVTSPSSISGSNASVSAGTNTLTLTKTVSVTPNVTKSGYISSGTAGNSSVSLTASVTTKGATTYTPGDSNQTIASGTYLTGAQTINAVQTESRITSPSTSEQVITPSSGYYLSSVTVNAMPRGTEGTPTATKGTVSNNSISVTPKVVNTSGWISGGTRTGTAVTVSASELVSGTKTITENGTGIDVTNYASVDVSVSGGGSSVVVDPLSVTSNGTYTAPSGHAYSPVTVNVSGGDTPTTEPWVRPSDWPDLSKMDVSGGDILYMTSYADEGRGFCSFYCTCTGSYTVEVGTISGSTFTAESTHTYSSNSYCNLYYGSANGTYKVLRVTGTAISKLYFRRATVAIGTFYGYADNQGIIDVVGKLPSSTGKALDCQNQYNIVNIEVSDITLTGDLTNMFSYCTSLASLDVSDWDTSAVTNMSNMFNYCYSLLSLDVSNWNTSAVTNMSNMFSYCRSLTSLDVSDWDTSAVTIINNIFNYCTSLTSLDVSDWDTSAVTNMSCVFYYCYILKNLDVSRWDTSAVTNMSYMFANCHSLTSLDVSDWDTSAVTSMSSMFNNCYTLTNLDVSRWDTSAVTNMSNVFYNCYTLTSLDVSGWDFSKVTTTSYATSIFSNCYGLYGSLTLPSTMISIGSSCFSNTRSVYEYHFLATTPPTLVTSAFNNMTDFGGKKIYVPSASLEAYQTATNWSTYASYMVGE